MRRQYGEVYFYRAFGLTLGSNRLVQGLQAAPAGPPDVQLDFRRLWPPGDDWPGRESDGWVRRDWPDTPQTEYFGWWALAAPAGEYHRLAYGAGEGRTEYLLSPGATHIAIIHNQPECPEGAVSLLLGQVMGCALRARGLTCLHASVPVSYTHLTLPTILRV